MEKIPLNTTEYKNNSQEEHEKKSEKKEEKIPWEKSRFNLDKSEKEEFLGLEIQGKKEFRDKIKDALLFLRLAPKKLAFSKEHIKRIEQWEKSGMNVFKDKPTFEIGKIWEESDPIYLASGIAHDAYHSFLCSKSEDAQENISPEAFTGEEAEKKCISFQIETLKEIAADEYMKQYEHVMSEHIKELEEIMKNPTYQNIPYEKRDW